MSYIITKTRTAMLKAFSFSVAAKSSFWHAKNTLHLNKEILSANYPRDFDSIFDAIDHC